MNIRKLIIFLIPMLFSVCKAESAVYFTLANNVTSYATVPYLAMGQTVGSISFRFKPYWDSLDGLVHGFFGSFLDGGNFFRMEKYLNDTWYVGWYTASTDYRLTPTAASMRVTTGTWYSVVYTWNDTTNASAVYLNGASKATGSSLVTFTPNQALVVGAYDVPTTSLLRACNCEIEDFRIYNRVITQSEINNLASNTFSINSNGLNVWNKFDDGYVGYTGGHLRDYSGNGYVSAVSPTASFTGGFGIYP